ncbi:MAG: GyrI-like domain-containing protein [Deltaproteobacteria bacterium]|jgi:hypothetical protein|nr:GyrI-like domain-containing protein [Deltaproteobacteria bacterium]MBW2530870.1 GyrI-like domain-containing protein [Deltaproteobacteria bacterium]
MSVVTLGLSACSNGAGTPVPPPQSPEPAPGSAPEAPTKDAAQELLDQAIAAAGGVAKLEAASSYRCKARMTMLGLTMDTTMQYKAGRVRTDATSPLGFPFARVEAVDDCWLQRGPAVIPCMPDGTQNSAKLQQLIRLAQLWPLKKGEGGQLTADTIVRDGKELDALHVKSPELEGTLLFDEQTHLVAGVEFEASFMGMKGKFEGVFSEHEPHCGVPMPTRWQASFGGRQFVDEKMSDLECGPLDDAIFARPKQVADGTVALRTHPAMAAVCLTHVGPYEGMSSKMPLLFGYVMKNRAPGIGAPLVTYRKAPPAVKEPEKFETDLCMRLNEPTDEGTLEGGLVARQLEQSDILVAYGVGEMAAKMKELTGLLMMEAKKRKLKPAGPLRLVAHASPAAFPPNQTLVELQLPVKK